MPFSPSQSGCKFGLWRQFCQVVWLVPFREHPDIDSSKLPSFLCVERRRSGANRISRSAKMTEFINTCVTFHRHVPSGTKHIAIDLMQNRRGKRLQCFSIEGFRSKTSSAESLEKSSRADVSVYVLMLQFQKQSVRVRPMSEKLGRSLSKNCLR